MKHKHFIEVSNICPTITLMYYLYSSQINLGCHTSLMIEPDHFEIFQQVELNQF